jgi:hypothetical protein
MVYTEVIIFFSCIGDSTQQFFFNCIIQISLFGLIKMKNIYVGRRAELHSIFSVFVMHINSQKIRRIRGNKFKEMEKF